MAQLLHDRDKKVRLAAAEVLLNRGYGRPQVNIHSEHDVNLLHLVAATALGTDLMQELGVTPEPNTIDMTTIPAE